MSKLQGRNLVGLFVALTLAAGTASATNGYYTTGTGTKSKGQAGAGSANRPWLMLFAQPVAPLPVATISPDEDWCSLTPSTPNT